MTKTNPNPGAPELAVILVTDCYKTVQPVLSCLRRQGDPSRLEVVLVTPAGGLSDADEVGLAEFGAVRRVTVESVERMPLARAAGVRATTAPLVFIGETHSYARPGWADIKAVKNHAVFTFDDNLISRPGPRIVDGLEKLAALIHPETFK